MWNNNTIEDEIRRNSLEYGVAVNTDRSIPDAKSGLKPVAKRILYDALIEGRVPSKPHVKSARIVGDVMGRFHPHGDSSIYGAMIRLSQDWVLRYPLIDVHGNNGTILGDGPAAMRYTEARLSKIAEEGLLKGLKKNVVDFIPNYDETEQEPITLPAVFPNLLCNPNEGIGWAMGCSWAPHNLNEVAIAINDFLNGNEPMLPGPDFPSGGIIINKDDIPGIMKTGRGSVKIRGKYKIEKQNIIFYEIPYGTRVESLMEQIGAAADEGKISGISDITNATGKKGGVKLVIKVERNTNPDVVVKQLFNKTSLQTTFSYNQVALVGKTPTEMNLKDAITIYVNHNLECIVREAQFDLDKALNRLEIVDGLLRALEDIDNIIKLIKKSASAAKAQEALITKYDFTEAQAKAIVNMKLGSLANLEKIALEKEGNDLAEKVEELQTLIANEDLQKDELKNRLKSIVDKYGDARRTELTQINIDKAEKEIAEVVPDKCVVVMTESGLIKRVPTSSFRKQHRNTKGVRTQDDITNMIIRTNTIDNLMIFTTKGKMYRLLVDDIPLGTNTTQGTSVRLLVDMDDDEYPNVIYSIYRDTDAKYIMFLTKNGLVKKTALEDFLKTKKKKGLLAINIKEDDDLADACLIKDENYLIITKSGMTIKFDSNKVPVSGRNAMGVKGINLKDGDEVIAGLPIRNTSDTLAVFTENGMCKKMDLNDFPLQGRGGKGLMCYKPTKSTGEIVDAALISDEDAVLIVGEKKSLCISASEISKLSRQSIGTQAIKNSKIVSVSKV